MCNLYILYFIDSKSKMTRTNLTIDGFGRYAFDIKKSCQGTQSLCNDDLSTFLIQ